MEGTLRHPSQVASKIPMLTKAMQLDRTVLRKQKQFSINQDKNQPGYL